VRRLALLALVTFTASFGLTAVAPTALATEQVFALPLGHLSDIVVDDAHGHVFVTGGGSGGIVVRDLAGAAVTTITNEPGAMQMALSEDGGTLYVALRSADAVAAISTTTLTETTRYATGASTCPATVAVTSGKVWFGYGCNGASGDLGVIDPATVDVPAVTLNKLPPNTFYYAPMLQASPAKPGLLVAGEGGLSPATLRILDVSSGDVVLGASNQPGSSLGDFALSPDGSHVVTAASSPYEHPSFKTTDLSPDGVYDSSSYPNSVALTGDLVAAGSNGLYSDDIYVHRTDGSLIRTFEVGGYASREGGLAAAGLAFDASGTVLYAATGGNGYSVVLHVLQEPGKSASTLTLTKPSSALIYHPYTLSGKLTAEGTTLPAGSVITVRRASSYGTANLPSRTTDAGGSFTIPDNVGHRGTYTYTASWAGDETHAGSSAVVALAVTGATPLLSITTSSGPYSYGAKPVVVAHLGTTHVRTLTIYAQEYGGSRYAIKTGTVDSQGNLSVAYTITRRTVFTASFPGDDAYQPRAVAKTLLSRAHLAQTLSGYYATSGSYRLYHVGTKPKLTVTVAPNNYGACIDFVAQVLRSGTWVTSATLSCSNLDAYSRTAAWYVTTAPSGTHVRVHATFRGSTLNAATTGGWVYLLFR
jgi:hypothetical protein